LAYDSEEELNQQSDEELFGFDEMEDWRQEVIDEMVEDFEQNNTK
jgi:hypothetical protein